MRLLTIIAGSVFVSLLILTPFIKSGEWLKPVADAVVTAQEQVWEERLAAAQTENLLQQFIQEIPATQILHRLSDLKEEAYRRLAAIYTTDGENKKAVKTLKKLTDFTPESFRNWMLLGEAYLVDGDSKKARTALEKAFAINPAEPDLFKEYATLLQTDGDTEALAHAIDVYKAMPLPMNTTQLYFTDVAGGWSEGNSVIFAAPPADGKSHTLTADFNDSMAWQALTTVVQLRLDPARYPDLEIKIEKLSCTGTKIAPYTWTDFTDWTTSNDSPWKSPNTLETTGEDPFLISPAVKIDPKLYTSCAVTFTISRPFLTDFIDASL